MYMKAGIQLPLSCARAYKLPACVQILHMDVKSSNVLLTRTLTAKISDVGIAKAMSPSGGVELTQVRCRSVCSVWTGSATRSTRTQHLTSMRTSTAVKGLCDLHWVQAAPSDSCTEDDC